MSTPDDAPYPEPRIVGAPRPVPPAPDLRLRPRKDNLMNRIIGLAASALVGYAAKHGTHLDADTIAWLILGAYSLVHQASAKVRGA